MNTKICPKCTKLLNKKLFGKNKDKKDGLQTYCKSCRKEIDRESYLKSDIKKNNNIKNKLKYKKECLSLIKKEKEKGCFICKESEHCVLDFHHLDPSTKEQNIADYASKGYSPKRIALEIEKCIILCSNCHRKVHAKILIL